jgi:hypothetical protein
MRIADGFIINIARLCGPTIVAADKHFSDAASPQWL